MFFLLGNSHRRIRSASGTVRRTEEHPWVLSSLRARHRPKRGDEEILFSSGAAPSTCLPFPFRAEGSASGCFPSARNKGRFLPPLGRRLIFLLSFFLSCKLRKCFFSSKENSPEECFFSFLFSTRRRNILGKPSPLRSFFFFLSARLLSIVVMTRFPFRFFFFLFDCRGKMVS